MIMFLSQYVNAAFSCHISYGASLPISSKWDGAIMPGDAHPPTSVVNLPTVRQLEKLPLRAVVAYAAKGARRVSSLLYDFVEMQIIEEALSIAEKVASTGQLDQLDAASTLRVAASVAEAAAAFDEDVPERLHFAAQSVRSATWAAYCVIEAAGRPEKARHYATLTAEAAKIAVNAAEILDESAAAAAINAAKRDYDILLNTFGEHEETVIGDAIDPLTLERM